MVMREVVTNVQTRQVPITDFRQPHAHLTARYKDNLNHLRVIRKITFVSTFKRYPHASNLAARNAKPCITCIHLNLDFCLEQQSQ